MENSVLYVGGVAMGIFKIDVDNFQWINGPEDDPQNLCLHGHVTARIGDTLLENSKYSLCLPSFDSSLWCYYQGQEKNPASPQLS